MGTDQIQPQRCYVDITVVMNLILVDFCNFKLKLRGNYKLPVLGVWGLYVAVHRATGRE